MQRREFIRRSIAAGAALPLATGSATLLAAPGAPARVLVVFLRGGYDAASLLVPSASSFYYEQRPNIAVARPGSAAPAAIERRMNSLRCMSDLLRLLSAA